MPGKAIRSPAGLTHATHESAASATQRIPSAYHSTRFLTDAGRRTLRTAADAARSAGDVELLAHAALASAPWGLATALTDEEGLIPLLEEALDQLPEADGALRARLLARLAAALYWSASAERRESLAEEAIAMARRVGDPATLAFVLSGLFALVALLPILAVRRPAAGQ